MQDNENCRVLVSMWLFNQVLEIILSRWQFMTVNFQGNVKVHKEKLPLRGFFRYQRWLHSEMFPDKVKDSSVRKEKSGKHLLKHSETTCLILNSENIKDGMWGRLSREKYLEAMPQKRKLPCLSWSWEENVCVGLSDTLWPWLISRDPCLEPQCWES